jgi:hypothetical protein
MSGLRGGGSVGEELIHLGVGRPHARPGEETMGLSLDRRQITRALCDATGLTEEEAWLLVAVAASVTVVTGCLRAVDAVMSAVDSVNNG